MYVFDKNLLQHKLSIFEPWKRVAFMWLCCHRMFANYVKFTAETGFGNPAKLTKAMQIAWGWIETEVLLDDLNNIIKKIDGLAPNTEDFVSPFTSAALDATNAVASLLEALKENSTSNLTELAVDVASLAVDTVDIYVQELSNITLKGDNLNREILSHPLMQAELNQQSSDIEYLGRLSKCQKDLDGLKSRVVKTQRGSLGL